MPPPAIDKNSDDDVKSYFSAPAEDTRERPWAEWQKMR